MLGIIPDALDAHSKLIKVPLLDKSVISDRSGTSLNCVSAGKIYMYL